MLSPVPGQSQSSEQLLIVAGSALLIPVQGGLAFSSLGENLVSKSLTGGWKEPPHSYASFFQVSTPLFEEFAKVL